MKHICTLVLFVLFPFVLSAQNWKTVSNKDTVYFEAGRHKVGFPAAYESNMLRAIWVDSSRQVNSDSIFYFYPSFRSVAIDSCIDTVAATWLGTRFIRSMDGVEHFFNSMADTVTVRTHAGINDSWIMGKDSQGIVFKATVSSMGTMMIDNLTDSFKTITIQAYFNNVVTGSAYNNKILQLSKEHGWLKALDFYRFPNSVSGWEDFGAVVDSTEHSRLGRDFKSLDLVKIDLAWKYAAGNEWIRYTEFGDLPYTIHQETITYDSVISSFSLSPDTIVVMLKTDQFTAVWPINLVTTNSGVHSDTISNVASQLLIHSVLPEYNGGDLSQNQQRFFKRYFTDTFCNGMRLVKSHQFEGNPLSYAGCWTVSPGVSGQLINDNAILPGFGLFSSNGEVHNIPPFTFTRTFYSYLHLGSCAWGTKSNVLALGLQATGIKPEFTIYPNPARDKVYVQTVGAEQPCTITIHDITGRQMVQVNSKSMTTGIPLLSYSPGIYILSVKSKDGVATYKLQVK